MSVAEKKEFGIKHVFTDVMNMESYKWVHGKREYHFNVPWVISTYRKDDETFRIYLGCAKYRGIDDWYIETETEVKLVPATGESLCKTKNYRYGSAKNIFMFSSEEIEKYLVDGNLTVEMNVKITEIEGIRTQKLRNFDESMKEFSDIVFIVKGEKFYVLKTYLAAHSSYFKSLLFGDFEESEKSEIELKDIDPFDFQNFLELIYGESAVDDTTVDGILRLADMYESKTAIRRCEEFLFNNSKKSLKMKFEMALKYKMKKLRNKCLSEIKSREDAISLAPKDANQMEPAAWAELFNKLASFE